MALKKEQQRPLPFWMQFVAGGTAGVSEILVMYPLDVVKTRFQLQVGGTHLSNASSGDRYTSILDCFRKIIKLEGPSRLYRGILAPILVEAPKRAVKFASNEQYTKLYQHLFQIPTVTQQLSILTGISAGMTEAIIVTSFELVKIRLQDKRNTAIYSSTLDCVCKILRHEGGPLAFFKGLEATLWRHAAWNGAYFGMIHKIRATLPEATTPEGTHIRNFVAGTLGGTLATTLNTPFDVVKTRVQAYIPSYPGGTYTAAAPQPYGWTLPALGIIVKQEGFSALYKGYLPKVLRLGPGGGILLLVFDQVSNWMRTYLL